MQPVETIKILADEYVLHSRLTWCGDAMDAADKRMLEREALRNMIQQWNANRLDLFALSEPNEVISRQVHTVSSSTITSPSKH